MTNNQCITYILLLLLCSSDSQVSSNTTPPISKSFAKNQSQNVEYKISVDLSTSLHECDRKYLSVVVDLRNNWTRTEKFMTLASAISPADVRFTSHYLVFDKTNAVVQTANPVPIAGILPGKIITVPVSLWDSFSAFTAKVGWDILFGVNDFKRLSDGRWDTTDFEELLKYSSSRNQPIPYFHIGNEPNAYGHNFNRTISPEQMANDSTALKNIISKFPLYKTSKLCGPEVSSVNRRESQTFLRRFLEAGAFDAIDEVSFHQYYVKGSTAQARDFLNATIMDNLKTDIETVYSIIKQTSPRPLPARLTETSAGYGGGGPMSNRYIAGFLWLDKLGVAAQMGITRVFRTSFIGATYALVDEGKSEPRPDYYLSLLYKRLIEGPVFNVSFVPHNPGFRIYAHCARNDTYSPGALVFYYLNLQNSEVEISLTQFVNADLDLYSLTPGDGDGLQSRYVKLNGNVLQMNRSQLPALIPKNYSGKISVAPESFGFVVVPKANVPLCHQYFSKTVVGKR